MLLGEEITGAICSGGLERGGHRRLFTKKVLEAISFFKHRSLQDTGPNPLRCPTVRKIIEWHLELACGTPQ